MIHSKKLLKPAFVLIFFLTSFRLLAGDFENSRFNHRILSINPGYVFSGNGDCWGINNNFSHFKTLSPLFFHQESVEGWIANGDSWIEGGYENQTGVNLTTEIGIVPFKAGDRILYLSGGAVFAYISNLSPRGGATYTYTTNGNTQILRLVDYSSESYLTPGFSLSAGYITKVNSKLYLNIRAQTKVYSSGDVLSTLSIGIGLNALNK